MAEFAANDGIRTHEKNRKKYLSENQGNRECGIGAVGSGRLAQRMQARNAYLCVQTF
jgi:hypothetical protein